MIHYYRYYIILYRYVTKYYFGGSQFLKLTQILQTTKGKDK